jgi:farnesyl diphosphate synthase
MIAGQMLDMQAEKTPLTLEQIITLQDKKTGALFAFCCEAGALLAQADDDSLAALRRYAYCFGLAFQIMDDILDATGDAVTLGKPTGQDAMAGKATFVSLLGLDGARRAAQDYADRATKALSSYGENANSLRQVMQFVLERSH